MARRFDDSSPGRMNFREIAREVRRRSGNRRKPSDIQIVNAIGSYAHRPHHLVPDAFDHLEWDENNSLAEADAERWITEHLVSHFAAIQAEWDDAEAFRRRRRGFQRDRLAHMREVGYAAFKAEFEAMHPERYTLRDVDGWLLRKYADRQADIPEPEVAIPKKPKPLNLRPAEPERAVDTVTVTQIKGYPRQKFRHLIFEGPHWIEAAVLRSGQIIRLIGAPDDKPEKLTIRVKWPASVNRADDEVVASLREFHRGWGYQAKMETGIWQ